MVTVHHFKVWNQRNGRYVVQPFKRTADGIQGIRTAEIIPGTAEEVELADLDANGRFNPMGSALAKQFGQ